MTTPPAARARAAAEAEAAVRVEALPHPGLPHAAIAAPSDRWLVQLFPHSPVRLLSGPIALVELATLFRRQPCSQEVRTR
ncbi:hypothetical protein [Streptomyces sp. URMC 125]|uniref:hypothetical protein n=1 Tax=Streptomyces sp. URMC 125 TaxID=3423419 RepID=UPI003F1D3A00